VKAACFVGFSWGILPQLQAAREREGHGLCLSLSRYRLNRPPPSSYVAMAGFHVIQSQVFILYSPNDTQARYTEQSATNVQCASPVNRHSRRALPQAASSKRDRNDWAWVVNAAPTAARLCGLSARARSRVTLRKMPVQFSELVFALSPNTRSGS